MNLRMLGVLFSFAIFLLPGHAAASGKSFQEAYIDRQVAELKTKLHLTAAQEAATRTAIEAVFQHSFGAKSVDQVYHEILQPDQLAAWEVFKQAQLVAEANSAAANGVNELAPQLGLSDAQKKLLYPALFQAEMKTPGHRGLEWQDAVMSVLTPSQRIIYRQQLAREEASTTTFNDSSLTYSLNVPPPGLKGAGSAVH